MSSSDIAVSVRGLSKSYTIAHGKEKHNTLAETLLDRLRHPFRKQGKETFWALNDVSFDIKKGDVVGIIGRNGAGKSTLLKVLSRITEPTKGEIDLYGRVGALLEVGAGFSGELSGRENIFLNGAILGMKRKEIQKQFDAIVDFAGVEKFLDTPVKRYSSGMYIRLAFAVAAHLDSEILIVDEVLAVGDLTFQKKCMGKMNEVATGGRTVVFVSHNLPAIRSLCTSGILLQKGSVCIKESAADCVDRYLKGENSAEPASTVHFLRPEGVNPYMRSIMLAIDGEPTATAMLGACYSLTVIWASDYPLQYPRIGFVLTTAGGDPLLNANNHYQRGAELQSFTCEGVIECNLGMVPLMPGRYNFSFWFGDQAHNSHIVQGVLMFDVLEHDVWGTGKLPPAISQFWWPTNFRAKQLESGDTNSVNS